MAKIDVKPILLKDVLFEVGDDDYAKHVAQVEFVPSTSIQTWQGLSPDAVFSAPGSTTWTCNLRYAQDWETEDSLSRYLYEHEGEEVDVTFEPKAGGAGWAATLIIVPGSIGGSVNAYAEATVTLGVQGRPTPIVPTP